MITAGFITFSLVLGIGLAMDAFSVSLADGLREPEMRLRKEAAIAGAFGVFQAVMPMIGWVCVHTIVEKFENFSKLLPWASFIVLGYIGGEMLYDAYQSRKSGVQVSFGRLTPKNLLIQAVATSIDALTVGFTIGEYTALPALVCVLIIGVVTFILSCAGVKTGQKMGTRLSSKADILGGVILIGIGIKILISGVTG